MGKKESSHQKHKSIHNITIQICHLLIFSGTNANAPATNVNLKKMIKIDEEILRKWENEYNSSDVNPFLALYKICGGVD